MFSDFREKYHSGKIPVTRLDRFEITVVSGERSGFIMHLKSSINLVSKFSIFTGCRVLEKF